MTLKLTSGDTSPALTGTVSADLTGAAAVVHIKRPDRSVFTKAVTVTDAATGAWLVEWVDGDLTQVGTHMVEVQVTFSNNAIQTFAINEQGQRNTFVVREQIG
jgi:hypothetical protein